MAYTGEEVGSIPAHIVTQFSATARRLDLSYNRIRWGKAKEGEREGEREGMSEGMSEGGKGGRKEGEREGREGGREGRKEGGKQ